jgi:hypothetical protein
MTGILKTAGFFYRKSASWKKRRTNFKNSQLPGKDMEGILKTASFLQKT